MDAMLCAQIVFIVYFAFLDHDIGIQSDASVIPQTELDVLATLWAKDIIAFSEESTPNQGHRALLTVEAVIVPLALLKGNVLAASKT